MNIVDSCAWLAYFADEPNAEHFYAPLKDADSLVVPTRTTYEVFKVVLRESGENEALQAVAAMQKGNVVGLTVSLSMAASKLSLLLYHSLLHVLYWLIFTHNILCVLVEFGTSEF